MSNKSIFKEGTLPYVIKRMAQDAPKGFLSRTLLKESLMAATDKEYQPYLDHEIDKMEKDLHIKTANTAIINLVKALGIDTSTFNADLSKQFNEFKKEDHYVDSDNFNIQNILNDNFDFVDLNEMLQRYNKINMQQMKK